MQKLGLATDVHVETADLTCYIDLFLNGLTEEQVELIRELLKDRGVSGERRRWQDLEGRRLVIWS
jgi:hypothetical protein